MMILKQLKSKLKLSSATIVAYEGIKTIRSVGECD